MLDLARVLLHFGLDDGAVSHAFMPMTPVQVCAVRHWPLARLRKAKRPLLTVTTSHRWFG